MPSTILPPAALDSKLKHFATLLIQGAAAWTEAGGLLVSLLPSYEGREDLLFAAVRGVCPGLNDAVLETFLSIGRRELYPLLALDESKGAQCLAALPYTEQERLYQHGVTIISGDPEEDAWEMELAGVTNLSAAQCQQVFNGARLRTIPEQKAWLRQQWEAQEQRRRHNQGKAAGRKTGTTSKIMHTGSRRGYDPDSRIPPAIPLDALNAATPLQLLQHSLDTAHAAMMDARRHLSALKLDHPKDSFIAATLKLIGQLRYAANNGEV